MNKWGVILFLGMFVLVIVPMMSASNEKLLCLSKDQVLKFSLCNSKMPDRTCTSTGGCQYCVTEISQGVYCPAQINLCNNIGLTCSQLEGTPGHQEDNNNSGENNDTNPGITPVINETNSSSNNDQNSNDNSNSDSNSNSDTTKKGNSNSEAIQRALTTSSNDGNTGNNLDSNGNVIVAKDDQKKSSSFPIVLLLFTTLILIGVFGLLVFKMNKKNVKKRKR